MVTDFRSFEAERARSIPFSSIRKVFEEAREMQARGIEVARMEIGRPDFDTPAHIKEAAKRALDNGEVHYAPNRGIEELREAVSEKLLEENSVAVEPATGVVVTVGCKEAIFLALAAFIQTQDEVLIPSPSWDTYRHTTTFLGGRPVMVPLHEENKFEPVPEDIEKRISSKTKVLVVISPHNPTGAVHSRETLQAIAELAVKHDLIVISDEIYEKLTYDGTEHHSVAALPGMSERTIVINGFSKAYAMDGWRIGYAAGPQQLIQPMVKIHQYTTNCVTTFVQHGAVAAYRGDQSGVAEMRNEFDRRRRMVVKHLREIPGVTLVEPRGAFYVFPSFKGLDMSSAELATFVLREAKVACVPGDVFGEESKYNLRFSYATSFESIEYGMERLSEAMSRMGV